MRQDGRHAVRADRRSSSRSSHCCPLLLAGCGGGSDGSGERGAGRHRHDEPPRRRHRRPRRRPARRTPWRPVDDALAGLDRRAQVAQLFVAGVPAGGPRRRRRARRGRRRRAVPGRPVGGPGDRARRHTRALAGPRPRPGAVGRRRPGGRRRPDPQGAGLRQPAVGPRAGRPAAAELAALAEGLGAALAAAGVNLDLAPVVDVVPAGTEAATSRSATSTGSTAAPPEVDAAAGTVVDGLAGAGVTATLKHFPGLGRVQANTDTRADVADTVTTAGDPQVTVFGTLARSAARPFVMVSSATYARIDPAPPGRVLARRPHRPAARAAGLRRRGRSPTTWATPAPSGTSPPASGRCASSPPAAPLVLSVDPAIVPDMIDAVLARDAADPAFAATVDAAVRTALLAKAGAGLLRLSQAPTSSRSRCGVADGVAVAVVVEVDEDVVAAAAPTPGSRSAHQRRSSSEYEPA